MYVYVEHLSGLYIAEAAYIAHLDGRYIAEGMCAAHVHGRYIVSDGSKSVMRERKYVK